MSSGKSNRPRRRLDSYVAKVNSLDLTAKLQSSKERLPVRSESTDMPPVFVPDPISHFHARDLPRNFKRSHKDGGWGRSRKRERGPPYNTVRERVAAFGSP